MCKLYSGITCYLQLNGWNGMIADDSFIRKGNHLEQRQKLGLTDRPRRSKSRELLSEPTTGLEKVEVHRIAKHTSVFLFWIMTVSDFMFDVAYFLMIWLILAGGEGEAGWCPIWSQRHTDRAERHGHWHGIRDRRVNAAHFTSYGQLTA